MKNVMVLAALVGALLLLPACATVVSPVGGFLFTNNVGFPGAVGTGDLSVSATGVSSAESYLGAYAHGDASIAAARDNAVADGAAPQSVAWVDFHVTSYWILYGKLETHVHFN